MSEEIIWSRNNLYAGRRSAVTHTAYDPQGRVLATWGATYPVAYEYDPPSPQGGLRRASAHGRMTAMATTRDPAHESINLLTLVPEGQSLSDLGPLTSDLDVTQWHYDPATGLLLQKLYADGKGPSYTYTPDGKLATRAWARRVDPQDPQSAAVTTAYSYDLTGALVGVSCNDGNPGVSYIPPTLVEPRPYTG